MSLYEKYGGEVTVSQLVERFYQKVLADARINHYFKNTDMERKNTRQLLSLRS